MDNAALAEIRDLIAPTQEIPDEKIEDEIIEDETVDNSEIIDEGEQAEADEDNTDDVETVGEDETQSSNDEQQTIKSLAAAIEVDQEYLYNVQMPMDDGTMVSIGDIKNQYQDAVREKTTLETQLAEQQTQLDNGQQALNAGQQLSQQEVQAQMEMAAVEKEFNDTDWTDLETYEPGQAALARQKLQERYQAANTAIQMASFQRHQDQQTLLQHAQTKMLEIIPEWSDPTVLKSDQALMNTAMIEAGYTQQEIGTIADPIALKLMRELVMLRAEKAGGKAAAKKVVKAPKVLKTGGITTPKKKTVTQNLVKQAKATGNKNDAFNAVKSLLANG